MENITIYTDGSACHASRAGGWGVWLRHNNGSIDYFGSLIQCNSALEAEFKAAYFGLYIAKNFIDQNYPNTKIVRIILVTDSSTVRDTYNHILNISKPIKRKTYTAEKDNIIKSLQYIKPHLLKLNKVKAHSGIDNKRSWANNRADKLAKKGLKEARKILNGY